MYRDFVEKQHFLVNIFFFFCHVLVAIIALPLIYVKLLIIKKNYEKGRGKIKR